MNTFESVQEQQLNELIEVGKHDKIFPLFSKKDLADRWGITISGVAWYKTKHDNFPKAIEGIFNSKPTRGVEFYPYFEVLRYERERKLR